MKILHALAGQKLGDPGMIYTRYITMYRKHIEQNYKHYIHAAKDLAVHGAQIDTVFWGYDPVGLSKDDDHLYIIIYNILYLI